MASERKKKHFNLNSDLLCYIKLTMHREAFAIEKNAGKINAK